MGKLLTYTAMVLGWRLIVAALIGGMAAESSDHELAGVIGFLAGAVISSMPFNDLLNAEMRAENNRGG